MFTSKNAQDKFVTVENTGKTDAYVRTIIAFELGEIDADDFGKIIRTSARSTETPGNFKYPWYKNEVGVVEIDGNNYVVVEFIYHGAELSSGSLRHANGVLPAGDTTYPSLCQVYMTADATNEHVEKIDGNKNGTYDILVVSQAVQAEGFADAETALNAGFGDITKDNHPWIDENVKFPTAVATAEELTAALANGESVYLTDDVTVTSTMEVAAGKSATIDLAGNTLSFASEEAKASCAINNKGTLTLKNGTVTYQGVGDPTFGYGTNTINNTGKLIIDGATIINTTNSGSSVAIDCSAGAELIVNDGEIVSEKNAIRLCPFGSGAINCTIKGGNITGARAVQIQLPSNKPEDAPDINLTVNGGELTGNGGGMAIYSYSAGQSFANVDVTITGGTFNGELGRYVPDDGTNDGWEAIAKP